MLVLYIERIKPLLEPEASDYLFPVRGKSKRADTLSKQLTRLALERVGVKYSPHLIRHLTAMMHTDARPGDLETARQLLGHRSSETTANSYNGFGQVAASKRHCELIAERRTYVSRLRSREVPMRDDTADARQARPAAKSRLPALRRKQRVG